MRVRVISFGTNWWTMRSSDTADSYCFRRRVAYFNAAALMCGRRLHHSAIWPGHIRFNANSGFDPEFLVRMIGRTFLCSGPNKIAGRVHLLFTRAVIEELPDAYLVTLNSAEHGAICFNEPGWRSSGVQPISISLRGSRFEAMLLMGAGDWVSGELGRWTIEATSNRLLLGEDSEGGPR